MKAVTATTWEEVTKVEKAADQHQQRLEVRGGQEKNNQTNLCAAYEPVTRAVTGLY